MEEKKKYLDLLGLIQYDEKLKQYIEDLMNKHSHTLTFGKYTYDGTEDVNIDIYDGNYNDK